jgi:hypothetical protein
MVRAQVLLLFKIKDKGKQFEQEEEILRLLFLV